MVIDPRMLKSYLNASVVADHRQCFNCGYDLFGLRRDGVCPECGTEIGLRSGPPRTPVEAAEVEFESRQPNGKPLYEAPAPTAKKWYYGWFDPRPTATLMELDPRDMRRMVLATGLLAIGITVLAAAGLGIYSCRIMLMFNESMDGQVPVALMLAAAAGGLLWMFGLAAVVWPRRGKITPRFRRRMLGELGAISVATRKSAYDQNLRWVCEWWPLPLRVGVVLFQATLPIAALASAAIIHQHGFERQLLKSSAGSALCMWLWILASLALAFACIVLMDFGRSAKDDHACSKVQRAAIGVFVGLAIEFGAPWMAEQGGGPIGLLLFPVMVIGLLVLPVSAGYLVVACWGLFSTARWAPKNKLEMEQKEAAKMQRDIDKGKKDEEHAWRMGY